MKTNGSSNGIAPLKFKEQKFWEKTKSVAITGGRAVIEKSLVGYYATTDTDTPAWAKTILVGALAYFVFPVDAIPDFIPTVGLADDFVALALALLAIKAHIKDEHKEKAKGQTGTIFS